MLWLSVSGKGSPYRNARNRAVRWRRNYSGARQAVLKEQKKSRGVWSPIVQFIGHFSVVQFTMTRPSSRCRLYSPAEWGPLAMR